MQKETVKVDYNKNKYICALPFRHLSVQTGGKIKVCCASSQWLRNSSGEVVSLSERSLNEVWNGPEMGEIREKMLRGERVSYCEGCYKNEEALEFSERQLNNHHLQLDQNLTDSHHKMYIEKQLKDPESLHVILDNTCNLRCRMCSPDFSYGLGKEIECAAKQSDNIETKNLVEKYYGFNTQRTGINEKTIEEDFFKVLPKIKRLWISGGEPMLSKRFKKIIKFCLDTGIHKNMELVFFTNLSIFDEELLEDLFKFKFLNFHISLDGIEDTLEYIRYPLKWNAMKANLEKFSKYQGRENMTLVFNIVPQINNILSIPKILDWTDAYLEKYFSRNVKVYPYYFSYLSWPRFLTVKLLPKIYLPFLTSSFERQLEKRQSLYDPSVHKITLYSLLNHIRTGNSSQEEVQEFWTYTNMLDRKRNQSFKSLNSQLFQALNGDEFQNRESEEAKQKVSSLLSPPEMLEL